MKNLAITMPFDQARPTVLRQGCKPTEFDRSSLIDERYALAREGTYSVYYLPIGSRPKESDRIIFVGLTPGFAQVQLAAKLFMSLPVEDRAQGGAFDEAIRTQVAFAGTMRSNLCKMLDETGLPDAFGVDGTAELFSLTCPDVATT